MTAIDEKSVTDTMAGITATVVTDPPNQIPADRRYSVAILLDPLRCGVWDRWTGTLVTEVAGGNPAAMALARRMNGRDVEPVDELAGLVSLLVDTSDVGFRRDAGDLGGGNADDYAEGAR